MSRFLFLQCLIAFALGEQSASDVKGVYPTENYNMMASRAGIVAPTSPVTMAKETSEEMNAPFPTNAGPSLNIMNHGAEGDLRGPSLRNNFLCFKRPGHCCDCGGSGCSKCDGGHSGCGKCDGGQSHSDCSKCDSGHSHEGPCGHPHHEHHSDCGAHHHEHHNDCGSTHHEHECVHHHHHHDSGCEAAGHHDHDGHPCNCHDEGHHDNKPFLKVTPSLVVKDVTSTHVETETSTHLEVFTRFSTRTVTDTVLSTHTQLYHPVKTLTFVDRVSAYEYPASTICVDHVHLRPTASPGH